MAPPTSPQASMPTCTTLTSLRPSSHNIIQQPATMQTRSTHIIANINSSCTLPSPVAVPPRKRQRSDAPPSVTQGLNTGSKRARDEFFDALVAGNPSAKDIIITRTIDGPDDLEKPELLRCFDLLHACGRATQPDATLSTTRKSIEGFLEAIFNGWKPGRGTVASEEKMVKPELDAHVDAEVVAGNICAHRAKHKDASACQGSEDCKTHVVAIATYTTTPPLLKIGLFKREHLEDQTTPLCALSCTNVNWKPSLDMARELRSLLEKKVVAKVHKYNKHMAVWQARKMILAWAKGEDDKEGCDSKWGFIDSDQVKVVLMGLGQDGESRGAARG